MDRRMSGLDRYNRQMLLPEVSAEGQARLSAAHVLVVGAGGLGCPALHYLAGAGIGQITVIDPDRVEESNLHRQVLYKMSDIGAPKAIRAAAHLTALNSNISVTPIHAPLTPDTAPALIAQADLVLDCADSFAVSYILSDLCFDAARPLISASALGQTGYAGGFCAGAPSLRALFPDLPENGASCATAGVLGPVVGMIGALQAQMALRVLLKATPSPLGQLVTLDLAQMQFGGFRFDSAEEPETALPFISTAALQPEDVVIELRSITEAPIPAHPNALRLPPDHLPTWPAPQDRRIVLCCSTGLRAWRAARTLTERNIALCAAGAA
jgi:molybdopterin/thiamine biosynthesis adenylyltransferase